MDSEARVADAGVSEDAAAVGQGSRTQLPARVQRLSDFFVRVVASEAAP